MGMVITVGVMVLLFKPRWLDNIHPLNPAQRGINDLVYPLSQLTTYTVNSSQRSMVAGSIVDGPTLSRQAQAAREARKAQTRKSMGEQDDWQERNWRAERRAAKEERRIMMNNRRRIRDAFAFTDMEE